MVRIHLLRVFFVSFSVVQYPAVKKRFCSMRGSNPRPLAHKTNTLPTELMEPTSPKHLIHSDSTHQQITSSVRGLVVMIVACQVMDPGSIPGERSFFYFFFVQMDAAWLCQRVCSLTFYQTKRSYQNSPRITNLKPTIITKQKAKRKWIQHHTVPGWSPTPVLSGLKPR